jgi:tol-pal system protein YbgF
MKRSLALTALLASTLLFVRCASSVGGDAPPSAAAPSPAPSPQAVTDPHLDDLQKSITELADRLEVMSDRLQRLEAAAEAPVQTAAAAPRPSDARPPVLEAPAARRSSTGSVPATVPPPSAPQTVISSAPRSSVAHSLSVLAIEEKYRRALTLYGQGKVAESRHGFQDVFDSDPAGELADNALYWLGETWFSAGNYNNALTYYLRVVKEYSDQNKAPDALFKSGMAYEKMGDLQLARRAFDDCIARYPYSTPAASARMELKRIKY